MNDRGQSCALKIKRDPFSITLSVAPLTSDEDLLFYLVGLSNLFLGIAFIHITTLMQQLRNYIHDFFSSISSRLCFLVLSGSVKLVCAVLCFCHVIYVSVPYLQYPMVNSFTISRKSTFENITIHVCVDLDAISRPRLQNISKRGLAYDSLNEATRMFSGVISFLLVRNLQGDFCPLTKPPVHQVYFRKGKKCFKFASLAHNCRERIAYPAHKKLHFIIAPKRPTILWEVYITNVDWPDKDESPSDLFVHFGKNERTSVWFAYKTITVHLLPYPYATNCKHFSRSQFVRRCLRAARNDYIADYAEDLIPESDNHTWECETKCNFNECHNKKLQTTTANLNIQQKFTNNWFFSDMKETLLTFQPSFSMSEFLVLVASVIIIWFGISFQNIFDILERLPPRQDQVINFNDTGYIRALMKKNFLIRFAKITIYALGVFHTYFIAQYYHKYETITSFTIHYNQNFRLPAFHVCYRAEHMKRNKNKDLNFARSAYSISERTYEKHDLLPTIKIGGNTFNLSQLTKYRTDFVFVIWKCSKLDFGQDFKFNKNDMLSSGHQSAVTLNPCAARNVSAFYSVQKEDTFEIVDFVQHGLISYGYLFTTKLLEWPYVTNCRDYKSVNLRSQREAQQKCVLEELWKSHNVTNKQSVRELSDTKQPAILESKATAFHVQRCNERYSKPDCYSDAFAIKRVDMPYSCVCNISPTESQTLIEHIPRIAPFEFVLHLTGIVGLWLGLDFTSLQLIIDHFFKN